MNYELLQRTVKMGSRSLWNHRLRSSLTTLGIIFGVSSVIAMLAIGEGASREAQRQIAKLGSSNIIIKTVKPPEDLGTKGQESSRLDYGLTYDDAERFRQVIPDVQVVVPVRRISQQAWYRNRKVGVDVVGTVPWYTEMSPVKVRRGRFLSDIDLRQQQGVCVIDDRVVKSLFVFDDPLDQDIKIAGNYYRVIGIASVFEGIKTGGAFEMKTAPSAAGAATGNVYIPLTAAKTRFGETTVQFGGTSAKIEKVELQEITVKVNSSDQVLATRDIIEGLMGRIHKKKDYQIEVPLEQLRLAANVKRTYNIVLGSIAAISLLVGGIGIMNIMLASVSERTREIGVRRALGATRKDIIIQFLSETLLLTLMGGILGIILGSLVPFFVTLFSGMPTAVTVSSLVLAFGISAAIGIAFGLYPAYRAAYMDPIESLRHE
jgi:putative ABC transport system permease protein